MRFGIGTVSSVEHRNGKRGASLRCDCGKEYWTQASNLYRSPGTKSCGCLKAASARQAKHKKRHRMDASVMILAGN